MKVQDVFEKLNPIPRGVERVHDYYVASSIMPSLGEETKAEKYQAAWEGFLQAYELRDQHPVKLIGGSKNGEIIHLPSGVGKIKLGGEEYRISVMAGDVSGSGQFYSGNWLAGHLIESQEEDKSSDG